MKGLDNGEYVTVECVIFWRQHKIPMPKMTALSFLVFAILNQADIILGGACCIKIISKSLGFRNKGGRSMISIE